MSEFEEEILGLAERYINQFQVWYGKNLNSDLFDVAEKLRAIESSKNLSAIFNFVALEGVVLSDNISSKLEVMEMEYGTLVVSTGICDLNEDELRWG